MTEHWLTKRLREHKPINDVENYPRISAITMLKLIQWRNSMLGIKRSLHEEQLIFEEKNEQVLAV